MAVQVSDFDRLSFTLFMAVALHAIIVLGITFAPELPSSVAQTMEITLSQFDDEQAPEQADFLAQTNQQGSGTEAEPLEMTSPQPADVPQPEVAEVQPEPKSTIEPQPSQSRAVVETDSARRQVSPQNDQIAPEPLPRAKRKSLMERSLEIASLEARLDAQQQAYARKPRVMRVTAAS
ncbi:MAG: energy transducer TonB, partial [Marinobacter sp.]